MRTQTLVVPGLALTLLLSSCSLERSPLVSERGAVAGAVVPSLSGMGGGHTPSGGGGGSSGSGGAAGGTPDAGPATSPDAGPALAPDAGPAAQPDAGPPAVPDAGPVGPDFPEGSCPAGYDCLPFLFLGFMCQQGGLLMSCAADETCPYEASCGTMAGKDELVCFLPCSL